MEILNLVGAIKPYDIESEVKIEYSNAAFNTAQIYIKYV
jgi:flagellar basal body L-ring protein FlgH